MAGEFISFIQEVQKLFINQPIYGEGVKQLCCHLLGIINEMTIANGKLLNKKVELYSLCFDYPFLPEFKKDIENYENTLLQFKSLVDKFLEQINFDTRVEYYGFLPASTYLKRNAELLGIENCNYVMNRYF